MPLKLYGTAFTPCTVRVTMILHEKQVPYILITLNLAQAEHRSPEHLENQPFGQVPYIDDDGFILYETRAICRYICGKYTNQGPNLIPSGLRANALFEQAAAIEANEFDPPASAAVHEMIFLPMKGFNSDRGVFGKHIATLSTRLDAYDLILSKQKYLAGDELTLADLFHLPNGSMLAVAGSDIMYTRPNVTRWFNDLTSRPSWQAAKGALPNRIIVEQKRLPSQLAVMSVIPTTRSSL